MWMPSVFLLFAGVFSQLFSHSWSDWASGKWYQVAIAIVLTWAVVGVGILRLEIGKWVNNIGAVLKVAIILAIGIGGVVFAIRHGSANHIGTRRRRAVVPRREVVPPGDRVHADRF